MILTQRGHKIRIVKLYHQVWPRGQCGPGSSEVGAIFSVRKPITQLPMLVMALVISYTCSTNHLYTCIIHCDDLLPKFATQCDASK
jgi:hypothetical protein